MTKTQWLFFYLSRQLWVRASLFALLAIVTALIAVFGKRFIPSSYGGDIGADAVDNILNILASSMLAVTTFSLNIMVTAYGAVTENVTPRAARLLREDKLTQNVLATFLGSFLYSLVGIIALSMGIYGGSGRIILFIMTMIVIVIIFITLIRWIGHLSSLGRVTETTATVEKITTQALLDRMAEPYLGCQACHSFTPDSSMIPLITKQIGYIEHIDMSYLQKCAKEKNYKIYIVVQIGSLTLPSKPLVYIAHSEASILPENIEDEIHGSFLKAFTIAQQRSFYTDPVFGLSVLSEIASRALSAAINDPGTAKDVITRSVRILAQWDEQLPQQDQTPDYPNLYMPSLKTETLLKTFFIPVISDGGGAIEIQLYLQKALLSLAKLKPDIFAEPCYNLAMRAVKRGEKSLRVQEDMTELQNHFEKIEEFRAKYYAQIAT